MGGGLLETNNQLERFTKDKRSKKLMYSILGSLMIVGVITLYKTFAFYEEKREFNVLKGRVPEFSQEDIQLAFTINGEKGETFPSKNSRYFGKSVTCEKGVEASWNNETWGLDLINSNQQKRINCSIEFKTISEFSEAKLGDYVSYTPSKTNYEITNDLTGCTGEGNVCDGLKKQSINPSELNLWRVIRKNSDGSIDLVSEYTSSNEVYFYGKEGYKNYIGSLNTIVKQYETEGITIGSRHMGYDGQTEKIDDESMLIKTRPWTESTTTNNSAKKSLREAQGGGDKLYLTDLGLIEKIYNRIETPKVNEPDVLSHYWIASRFYGAGNDVNWDFRIRSSEKICDVFGYFYGYLEHDYSYPLRPIITLKAEMKASGEGSFTLPWKIN